MLGTNSRKFECRVCKYIHISGGTNLSSSSKFDLFEEFEFVKFDLRAGMKSSRCSKFDV